MLIRIRYHDNTDGLVDARELERLIASGGIKAFKRSSGWVRLGVDPVRRSWAERRMPERMINLYV